MDAVDQAALVKNGEVTPLELLEAAIERIERIDPVLNAVVIRWFDHARDTARGELPDGPFRGVPFLIKDLFAGYAGQPISNGNLAFKNEKVISDAATTTPATVAPAAWTPDQQSRTGKCADHRTTRRGATHNPWDLSRSPGRAVARRRRRQRHGSFAHASDGGGRSTASCCGLVGLKPSQQDLARSDPRRNRAVG
jgi:amidase